MEFFDIFGFVFSGLLPILVIVGIIALIVALVRRRGPTARETGIGTPRRLYYYTLSFVALMVSVSGVLSLVDYLADSLSERELVSQGESQLALALALTLVGAPIWLFHWRLAQQAIRRFPTEAHTDSRKVYLYLILAVSGGMGAFGLVSLLRWLLGADSFNGLHLAFPLVWSAVWAYHWSVERQEVPRSRAADIIRGVYVYVTSLYGLVMLLTGVGIILRNLLLEVYETLFETEVLFGSDTLWSDATQTALAVSLVGATFWWWHWHRLARGDTVSGLRQVYLYVFAILGGAGAVVGTLIVLIFGVFQWAFGEPDAARAAEHFRFLPANMAGLVTATALWGFHWAVINQESAIAVGGLPAARRAYRYLLAILGLGTLAAGLIIIFGVVLGVVAPQAGEELLRVDWWRNPLAMAATLLLVGAPLWSFHWFAIQRDVAARLAERAALSRRIYVYSVLGAAILASLVNLSAVLFMLFRDLLEGELAAQTVYDAKWSIGVLLTAIAVGVYHWLVLQEDRRAMPAQEEEPTEAIAVRKAVIALAADAAQPLVRRLELQLGFPIRLWRRLDAGVGVPTLTDEEMSATRERIAQAPGERVVLTIDASGVQVVPYQES